MFFFPETLKFFNRSIFVNHPPFEAVIHTEEELAFQNSGNDVIKEIILEYEEPRDSLMVKDKSGTYVVYLPKTEIMTRGREKGYLDKEMLHKVDNDKIHLLWIMLSKPLAPGEQEQLTITYLSNYLPSEQPSLQPANSLKTKLKIFDPVTNYQRIKFYKEETVTMTTSWEHGLSNRWIFVFAQDEDGARMSLKGDELNFKRQEGISKLDLTPKFRVDKRIQEVFVMYLIELGKSEKLLIRTLLAFSLLFPLTEILLIIFHLNSIPSLFYMIQVEVVIILTLSFAQHRTRLTDYKKHLVLAIILTASLFSVGLAYLL